MMQRSLRALRRQGDAARGRRGNPAELGARRRHVGTAARKTPPSLKDSLEAAAVRRGLQSLSTPSAHSPVEHAALVGTDTAIARTIGGLELVSSTFRQMAPFIAAHRDTTVVIHVPGECLESELFPSLADDIVLLHTLGMKIVLVVGCRPQIDRRLYLAGIDIDPSAERHGVRPSDEFVLQQVVESWGWCRVQLQSHVGRGLATGAQIKRLGLQGGMVHVASGNFVIAQPMGVLDGVDMMYAGTVRRVNTSRLSQLLDSGDIVLVGCLGYSASGEVFNCASEEVATACASQLGAQKLIFMYEGDEVFNLDDSVVTDEDCESGGRFVRSMDPELAERCIAATEEPHLADRQQHRGGGGSGSAPAAGGLEEKHSIEETRPFGFSSSFPLYLRQAVTAVENGVQRVHLVNRHVDGSLLGELYTEAGNGVLISELGECDEVPEKATLHVTPTLHATPTLSVSDSRASDQSIRRERER